jgi:selenocysteine lyase/cysteine desulfurase
MNNNRLDLFSITACSNVTGKRYENQIVSKIHNYMINVRNKGGNIYLLMDYACSAPYIDIDISNIGIDGLYFSGHKFFGGQGTPGVLILPQELCQIKEPYQQGGGCVENADDMNIIYKEDVEQSETGGTPNIVGIIRLGCALMMKNKLMPRIKKIKEFTLKYVSYRLSKLEGKYPSLKIIGLKNKNNDDLPIYPITIDNLHYNFITVLFNDLFGIQTRGGISCCGTFGRICNEKFNKNGWCRITFSYLHSFDETNKILDSLEYIIQHGSKYLDHYDYDKSKNLYIIKNTIYQ